MTALLLVGLAVCIGYYFGAASVVGETLANSQATDYEVIVWLGGNASSFSIGRIMEFAVSNVETFVTTSIESAKTDVNKTINTVTKNLLEVTLPDEITSLLTALMTNFKVMEILEAVDDLVYAILNATEYSDYIWKKYNLTVPTIVNNALELNFLLNSTITNCSATPSENLRNKFNPAKVVPVPSEVTLLLNRTHIQLQELKSNLDNITQHLKAVQEEVMKELESKLDLQQILSGMYDLMGSLEEQFNQITVQINSMTRKVSGYLGEYSGTAKAVIYALCLPCLLAGILFLVLLTFYLFEAIRRHLFSITGESASEGTFELIISKTITCCSVYEFLFQTLTDLVRLLKVCSS
ncbi:unnamed protein product [Dibothriocephalus latus]|uniref:Protein tweety homolog n=1 Tax=Dibothriocephalus latus TaxID=60516 RepID=A0A3P7PJR2_DIBLA|nr:unnamed protein product [Dibothriocephalus latus]